MNPARGHHLQDESNDRGVENDLREERGDGGVALVALERLGRHVQLLFHDRGAGGGARDGKGEDADVSRLQQQLDRLASADARFVHDGADRMTSADHDDNGQASAESERTHQHEVRRADCVDIGRDDGSPGGASQAGACADEAEQPLGLTGVVDVVRQRPELADQENAEDLPEQVEADGHPLGTRHAAEAKRRRAGR